MKLMWQMLMVPANAIALSLLLLGVAVGTDKCSTLALAHLSLNLAS